MRTTNFLHIFQLNEFLTESEEETGRACAESRSLCEFIQSVKLLLGSAVSGK